MKLADAKPGDFLQDADGAVWLRKKDVAVCLHDPADERDGDYTGLPSDPFTIRCAERFGPFTRLVPEKEQE